MSRLATIVATAALLAAPGGCTPEEPADSPEATAGGGGGAAASPAADRVFERDLVFLATRGDSVLIVPWILSARPRPDGVDRAARAWLARGGAWERFLEEEWTSEPTRTPWRIVPREAMRILVGDGDALERILFEEGPRELDVILQEPIVEWRGPLGETLRVLDGSLVLATERVPGIVFDLSRARPAHSAGRDAWAVLTSGDSLLAVLDAPDVEGRMRGWARVDGEEVRWPELTLEWTETRAFDRARRDVPVAWALTSADGELEGSIEVRSAHLEAGEGEGPILPVDALFEVAGTLTVAGASYPVRGLLRHAEP